MKNVKLTILILFMSLFIAGCGDTLEMPQPADANDGTTRSSSTFEASINNVDYVKNLFTALDFLNLNKTDYHFSTGPAKPETLFGYNYHIQGISYWNGNYYITRNRSSGENDQQLLILSEARSRIIHALTLDASSTHPGSLQIYNGILAVTFDNPNMLKLYDLTTNSIQPELKAQLNNTGGIGAGITEYNDNYLVATYTDRNGGITFRLFDKSFNMIAEKDWHAASQGKSDWIPYKTWQDKPGSNIYENINLIREQLSPFLPPAYYLIMYCTDPQRLDVFYLKINNANLTDLEVRMVRTKLVEDPGNGGFRMGAGLAITGNNERIRFFSTRKHIHSSGSNDNIITQYNPHPWANTYAFETGIQTDISIDDYGNCLALFRTNSEAIFYRVGKIDLINNQIIWGGSYELKDSRVKSWGSHVSVSLNNNGYCVATHKSSGSGKDLYYRVGKINTTNKTVDWGAENKYDTGGNMSVAINNYNQIIEVHQGYSGGAHKKNHYYSVGTINTSSKTITWKKKGTEFDTGGTIAIALDDNGRCLNTHLGSASSISHRDNRYYRKGVVNFTNGEVAWGSSILYDTGGDGDIAISNNGRSLEVHKGSPYSLSHGNNHYYKTGTFNFLSNSFNWVEEALFQTGGGLSCDINNNGEGICAFELSGRLYYRIFR